MNTKEVGKVLGISKHRDWWNRQSARRVTEHSANLDNWQPVRPTVKRLNARERRRIRRALRRRDEMRLNAH